MSTAVSTIRPGYGPRAAGLWGSPDLERACVETRARPNQTWAARYDGDFDRAMRFLDASMAERDRREAAEPRAWRSASSRVACLPSRRN